MEARSARGQDCAFKFIKFEPDPVALCSLNEQQEVEHAANTMLWSNGGHPNLVAYYGPAHAVHPRLVDQRVTGLCFGLQRRSLNDALA